MTKIFHWPHERPKKVGAWLILIIFKPQKGWKQKQETEIETKKFPKVGPNRHPPCFCFSKIEIETETVFKGVGWQFEKIEKTNFVATCFCFQLL